MCFYYLFSTSTLGDMSIVIVIQYVCLMLLFTSITAVGGIGEMKKIKGHKHTFVVVSNKTIQLEMRFQANPSWSMMS